MGRAGGGFSVGDAYEKNIETMRYLLIVTLLLGGCSGVIETVALSTTANIISEMIMDEVKDDCGKQVE